MGYGSRPLNRSHWILIRNPVSLSRPLNQPFVLLFFSELMNNFSRIDNLLDELSAVRQFLVDVEKGTHLWNQFDRLEDKLCAELASEYAEAE